MSDEESVEVDSEGVDEEELCTQDASATSTAASTPPQPAVVQQALPADKQGSSLQELLQLRAKQAIEGAKVREIVRNNQRLADGYLVSLLQRVVHKLGWVEEEKANRDKSRQKQSEKKADRPSRRRERKRELRRQLPEYEEVPGGGQFLMMLLGKNKQPPHPARKNNEKDEAGKDNSAMGGDPAIVQASMGWPEAAAKPSAEAPSIGKPKASSGKPIGGGREAAFAPPGLSSPPGRAVGTGAKASNKSRHADAQSRPHGSPVGEELNLQSLLRGSGITEDGPDDFAAKSPKLLKEAQGPASHSSRASDRIFGKVQRLVGLQEEKAQAERLSPVIPPMPGFSIWGSPSSGPCASPSGPSAGDPWSSCGGDPWAPLPESSVGLPPGLAAAPGLEQRSPPGPPPATSSSSAPAAASHRGRRGGRNRERKRGEVQDQDLWDMPLTSHGSSASKVEMDLPEFFRDSAAPGFCDYILDGRGCLELELEPAHARGYKAKVYEGFAGSDYAVTANGSMADDSAYNACLGSLCLDEDDSEEEVIVFQ